jgi:arabinogalactan oligomer/maltooligosaccharide transport system substrate-binding protein
MLTKTFFRRARIALELLFLLVYLLPAGVQAAPGQSSNLNASASTVYLPLALNKYSPNEITFWYSYGVAEEQALNAVLAQAAIDLPQYKIHAMQVPMNDIYNNYIAAVTAGGGPDMFILPNDWLGDDVRAGYITDITALAAGRLGDYAPLSVQGMSLDGKLYGIPESLKALAFWYDKTWIVTPPATTAALMSMMNGGMPIAVSYGCYHQWGFYGAFGGTVFDNNWNINAVNQGMVDAMTYLDDLYQVSKAHGWPRTDSDGLVPFTSHAVAAITNGNWAMGDYKAALGNNLAVAPLPAGPSGPATPMLGVDGYYINPNSTKKAAAVDVALYLTGKKAEEQMMAAMHVPAINTATITDPLILSLKAIFLNSYVRPQVPQLGQYWEHFCNTDEVFEGGMDPLTWLTNNTNAANLP